MRSTSRSPRSSQRSTISKKTAAPTTGISSAHPTTERPVCRRKDQSRNVQPRLSSRKRTQAAHHKAHYHSSRSEKRDGNARRGRNSLRCGLSRTSRGSAPKQGKELTEYFSTVSRFKYSIAQIRMVNSPESPFFTIIETK